jgi:hypothetical protein
MVVTVDGVQSAILRIEGKRIKLYHTFDEKVRSLFIIRGTDVDLL